MVYQSPYNIKKQFGIPGFSGQDSGLQDQSDALARSYQDYEAQLGSQLNKYNVHGGGAVSSINKLQDFTRNQASMLGRAKQFTEVRNNLTKLTTEYQTTLKNYLKDKETMQHRVSIFGGREEYAAGMAKNEAKLNELKSQIDSLTSQASSFSDNPFVANAASGMGNVSAQAQTAYDQAKSTDFGDIQSTIGQVAGGLIAGPMLGAAGNFLFKDAMPMVAGTPTGPLQVGSTTAGPLAGLNPAIKGIVDSYTKFTGSNPITDISNMVMSGTPIDKALTQIVEKGKNFQALNQMNTIMGQPTKAVRNAKGEISYEWSKPTSTTKDLPKITPNMISNGIVGKKWDADDTTAEAAKGYTLMDAMYGGKHVKVEIKTSKVPTVSPTKFTPTMLQAGIVRMDSLSAAEQKATPKGQQMEMVGDDGVKHKYYVPPKEASTAAIRRGETKAEGEALNKLLPNISGMATSFNNQVEGAPSYEVAISALFKPSITAPDGSTIALTDSLRMRLKYYIALAYGKQDEATALLKQMMSGSTK